MLKPEITIWPFIVFEAIVFALMGIMTGLSFVPGKRHKERATDEPYESGIPPTGNACLPFSSRFYLIAMFFCDFQFGYSLYYTLGSIFSRTRTSRLHWNCPVYCYYKFFVIKGYYADGRYFHGKN